MILKGEPTVPCTYRRSSTCALHRQGCVPASYGDTESYWPIACTHQERN